MSMETEIIKLDKPVVTRKVPMTSRGCDIFRKIRDLQKAEFCRVKGVEDVNIPFPTSFHMILEDYAKLKGIKV